MWELCPITLSFFKCIHALLKHLASETPLKMLNLRICYVVRSQCVVLSCYYQIFVFKLFSYQFINTDKREKMCDKENLTSKKQP